MAWRRAWLLLPMAGLMLVPTGRAAGETPPALSPIAEALADGGASAHGEDPALSNRLAIVGGGYDALALRVHLIRQARHSIDIQTFIWSNDECGRLMMYELIQAARRGVRVRILADQLASAKDPEIVAFLSTVSTNLAIKHYRPPLSRIDPAWYQSLFAAFGSFHGINQRMHNKVLIVDDAVLVTGGRNIENSYYDHATGMNYRDRDVLALGPVVREAAESFGQYWACRHAVPSSELVDVAAVVRKGGFAQPETRDDFDFGGYFVELDRQADDRDYLAAHVEAALRPVSRVTFVADPPGKGRGGFFSSKTSRIAGVLGDAIAQARESIVMQTPYLVLSDRAAKLLKSRKRANAGLRIRVSSNSFASTDNLMAYSGNYRKRGAYVDGIGMTIYEFKPYPEHLLDLFPQFPRMQRRAEARLPKGAQDRGPFLCMHAKSLVIDGRVAFVGSYNLDPRSESLNTEAGLLVEDAAFAQALQAEIERDMRAGNSWVIAHRQMPLGLDAVNGMVDSVLSLSPVDIWPIQNTTSYELIPGAVEVDPGHPDFYRNYREAGAFPGTEGWLTTKEITTRLFKAVGAPLTPLL